MADMPLVGEEFAGYRLVEVLGRGGMSIVFRAENPRLGNVIALKVIDAALAASDVFRTRFLEESRLAASMNHPNVIPIHDTGSSDGLLYLAMRCVSGTDLRQMLAKRGRLPADRAVFLLSQAARALDAAHRRGLVHRDVKPANLLVERGNDGADPEHVYLADFGITKHLASRTGPTASGGFLGTIDYVAPEQIRGFSVLGLADQYSLGCVLYECLTGHVPFEQEFGPAVMWAHVEEPPGRPSALRPDLPAAIDAVFARVLAKDPGDRYENCRDFVAAARRALEPAAERPGAERPAVSGPLRTLLPSPVPVRVPTLLPYPGELTHEGRGPFQPLASRRMAEETSADEWALDEPVTDEPLAEGRAPEEPAPEATWPPRAASAAALWGAARPAPPVPGFSEPTELPDLPAEAELTSAPRPAEDPWLAEPPGPGGGRGRAPRSGPRGWRRRPRRGWLVALVVIVVAALALIWVRLSPDGGHGGPADAASTGAATGQASAPATGSTAASMGASASTGMSASPGATDCTSEQPGAGQGGPTTLAGVLTDANRCSVPAGIIPTAHCKSQAGPPGEQVVVCAAPTSAISQVTFRTYPTLAALYAAYTSSVKSLSGSGTFRQDTSASCGDTGATYAEAGWNHQELHPRQYTVSQMAAGKVPQLDAMGRLACFSAGRSRDLVWTTGVGKMLAVATGSGSASAVYDWWAEIHHVIIFPGTEMCGMSGRMNSVPLGNLIQEPVCPAGAGMSS
jgi:Protein kinase domain